MTGFIANRVWINFGCAKSIKEAQRKRSSDQRTGASVVGVKNALPPCCAHNRLQFFCDRSGRFIPSNLHKLPLPFGSNPLERLSQPRLAIDPGTVISNRTFSTEFTPTNRMLWITFDSNNLTLLFDNHDAASIVAVTGTGCTNDFSDFRHRLLPTIGTIGMKFNVEPTQFFVNRMVDHPISVLEKTQVDKAKLFYSKNGMVKSANFATINKANLLLVLFLPSNAIFKYCYS
jgi:hypothetical protein